MGMVQSDSERLVVDFNKVRVITECEVCDKDGDVRPVEIEKASGGTFRLIVCAMCALRLMNVERD